MADVYTSEPLGSQYQLEKFIKHTVRELFGDVVSVFDSTSTGRYAEYTAGASSGAVEFDDYGRRNIVILGGHPTAYAYKDRRLEGPQDGAKVVSSSEAGSIHAFPIDASRLRTETCVNCGHPVIT